MYACFPGVGVSRSVVDAAGKLPFDVLHIRRETTASVAEVNALLESTSLRTAECGDVYRGLARLCAAGKPGLQERSALRAAIVCVDDLGPPELEFFSIVARIRRELPVYVYAGRQEDFRVAKAIRLGAKGWVTEEVVRSLARRIVPPPAEPRDADYKTGGAIAGSIQIQPDEAEAELDEPRSSRAESDVEAPLEAVEPGQAETEASNAVEDETPAGPARVPWLRYSDQPVRTAPESTAPPAKEAANEIGVGQESPGSPKRGPLLTEAELQALIGDDISAIAPPEPPRGEADETRGEEGSL